MVANEAIVTRVERLEREVRRWRHVAAALGLSVAALAIVGAAAPRGRTVEARKFVIKDSAGRVRAELGPTESEAEIALRFKDERGSSRLTVGLQNDSALLVLSDQAGRPRSGLVTLGHGAPSLTLYDATGRARLEVGVSREGEPRVTAMDARGGPAWKAP